MNNSELNDEEEVVDTEAKGIQVITSGPDTIQKALARSEFGFFANVVEKANDFFRNELRKAVTDAVQSPGIREEVEQMKQLQKDLKILLERAGYGDEAKSLENEDEWVAIDVGGTTIRTRARVWKKSPLIAVVISAARKNNETPSLDLNPGTMQVIVEYLRRNRDPRVLDGLPEHTVQYYFDYLGLQPKYDGRLLSYSEAKQGVFYFIGTNEMKESWSNPVDSKRLKVTLSSSGGSGVNSICDREWTTGAVENSYGRTPAWIEFDLQAYALIPTSYYVHQDRDHFLRNWKFEGSSDGKTYNVIQEYVQNATISDSTRFGHFKVSCRKPYRIFRIYITGPSHKGAQNFDFTQIELFGHCMQASKLIFKP
mmetsp:Transcript_12942/g.31719  ORF Transcript_12942/g.31719 Transcript_12942/m.31719 type:complete len:368 (-) Transcript_12942:121-1224(-)